MKPDPTEMHWLDAHHALTLAELAELSGLPASELAELVDCGVLSPMDVNAAEVSFSAECLTVARTAARLQADFELPASGLALALSLLQQVRGLEARLRELEARLPRMHG